MTSPVRDERIILRLAREVEDLRGELRDARKQAGYTEAARRDRTLMEAIDALDALSGPEVTVREARATVRALMDRPMPLMAHPSQTECQSTGKENGP